MNDRRWCKLEPAARRALRCWLGALAAVVMISCATGANAPVTSAVPEPEDTVDSLDLLVTRARSAWRALKSTYEDIEADTNSYELRQVPYVDRNSQEVCCEAKIAKTGWPALLLKNKQHYEKDYTTAVKRIGIVARAAAPAPWTTELNRCTAMRPSDAAISCLTQALALRPAPAEAPLPQGPPPAPAPRTTAGGAR